MSPALTFAIPFHHGVSYLEEAVASVLAQRHADWELLVVDDAGPDGVSAHRLVQSYGDARLRYVRNPENLGLAGNWNRCAALASASLVTLLHADDRLLPRYTDAVLAAHDRHPAAFAVFTEAAIIDADGHPTFSLVDRAKTLIRPGRDEVVLQGEDGLAALMRGQFVMCPTLCYRTGRLRRTPFDPRWKQVLDLDLLARVLLTGEALVGVPDVAYEYRRHGGSQTAIQTADASRFREELALHAEVAALARAAGMRRAERTARLAPTLRVHLGLRVADDLAAGRRSSAREKWSLLRGSSGR